MCVCRAQVRVLEQRNLLSVLTMPMYCVCLDLYIFHENDIIPLARSLARSPVLALRHCFVPSADFFWLMVIERCGLRERIQYQYLCMNIYTIMTDTGVYGLLACSVRHIRKISNLPIAPEIQRFTIFGLVILFFSLAAFGFLFCSPRLITCARLSITCSTMKINCQTLETVECVRMMFGFLGSN